MMISFRKYGMNGVLIFISTILVLGLVGYLVSVAVKSGLAPKITENVVINTDAIFLTGPVMTISEAKILSISRKFIKVEVTPKMMGKTTNPISINVLLDENTKYVNADYFVPYVFKTVGDGSATANPSLTLANFRVGEMVDIVLKNDYRFSNKTNILATQIGKSVGNNLVSGTVTSVGAEGFELSVGLPRAAFSGTYLVNIDQESEVIKYIESKPSLIGLSDLKEGSFVTAYTDTAIEGKMIKGVLVVLEQPLIPEPEPQIEIPSPSLEPLPVE